METNKFKEAVLLNDKIEKLKKEINELKNITYTTIRFGGNFNVSMPIDISIELFSDLIGTLLSSKEVELSETVDKFNLL